MSTVPLNAHVGDVDANGDIISGLVELVGPGTFLLEPTTTRTVPPATAPLQSSTAKLQAVVRRARETSGHQRLRWTLRERRAFDELVKRGATC